MLDKTKVFNLIKKISWGIVCGLFGIVFLITAWLFVDKFIRKSPVPSFLGYSTLTIQTGSMSGTMEIGDMIIIKDTGDYKIGDIITFMPDGAVIPTTHRIINYTATGEFVTKGDANNVKDTDNATADQILGEVVLHLPKLGQFATWVKMEGWMYILATIGVVVLGTFMLKSTQEECVPESGEDGNAPESQTGAGENTAELQTGEVENTAESQTGECENTAESQTSEGETAPSL